VAVNKDIPKVRNPPSGDGHHVTERYMTVTELAERDAMPAKQKTRVKGRGTRMRWRTTDGRILEWDYQHGAVEMYDKRGRHLGEFDAETGTQNKPADPKRRIEP
jgi:hypothetical protein